MTISKFIKKRLSLIAIQRYIEYLRSLNQFNTKWKEEQTVVNKNSFPALTTKEKNEIDDFWEKYGIKFPNHGVFKMFYAINGTQSPAFIPRSIALVLESYYNDKNAVYGWDDKNVYELVLPYLSFPKALCHFINGHLYDREWNRYANDDASLSRLAKSIYSVMPEHKQVIVKKTSNTCAGKGVVKKTLLTEQDVFMLIKSEIKEDAFIMQECIQQSPFLQQFNETSVNMFRINTFRGKNSIYVLSVSLRYGIKGMATDVAFIDGKEIVNVVGVDLETGNIKDKLYDIDREKTFDCYTSIKDKKVPALETMIDMAKNAHDKLPFFDFIGWDFTLDQDNNPICLEYNIEYSGTQLYQFANGPLAGIYTDEYLSPLLLEEVRQRIPKRFKL